MNPYEVNADREVEQLYSAITQRPAFSYAPASDPLYRGYADRYVQGGRLAMRDTVGQSAALTGGYASSYAQSAGQQRYDEYLRQLGEVLPELYGQAWERYRAEGADLREQYGLAWERRADQYRRGRDALADRRWETEQQQKAAESAYRRQQDSYAQLYKLIASTGYQPTDAELEAAGLSRAQAEALRYEYLRQITPAEAASGGGGGRRRSSSRSGSKSGGGSAYPGGSGSGATAGFTTVAPTLGALAGLAGSKKR